MSRWIDTVQAAAVLDMDVGALRRIIKSSRNPPPFVRPSERSMLFDVEVLKKWQQGWRGSIAQRATTE